MATEIAMLHDTSKCSGCRACMVACKQWKELPAEITPFTGEFQSHKDLSPKTYNLLRMKEELRDGKLNWRFLKFQCMHCGVPGCVEVCPVGAITKTFEGPVVYDTDLCIGCKYCETGCPFGIPKVDRQTEKVTKCNLCAERIENGMVPSCAKTCTSDAIIFGSREDMVAKAAARVSALKSVYPNAELYGTDKMDGVGGTSMMYILTDSPSVFGLPEEPKTSSSLAWKKRIHTGGKVLVGAAAVAIGGAVVLNTIKGKKADGEDKHE